MHRKATSIVVTDRVSGRIWGIYHDACIKGSIDGTQED